MSDFLSEGPFWAVFTALFFGAMARGQLLYWIGRIPTEQALKRTAPTTGWKARAHRWLSDGGADAGVRSIQRWGLPVVSFCYVTVGFQSLVQAAAGMLRTPLPWYILAQIPGSLAWAAIYSTIGFAMWAAAAAAAAGSPWGVLTIAVVLAAIVVLIVRRRRRRKRAGVEAEQAVQAHTAAGTLPGSPAPVGHRGRADGERRDALGRSQAAGSTPSGTPPGPGEHAPAPTASDAQTNGRADDDASRNSSDASRSSDTTATSPDRATHSQ